MAAATPLDIVGLLTGQGRESRKLRVAKIINKTPAELKCIVHDGSRTALIPIDLPAARDIEKGDCIVIKNVHVRGDGRGRHLHATAAERQPMLLADLRVGRSAMQVIEATVTSIWAPAATAAACFSLHLRQGQEDIKVCAFGQAAAAHYNKMAKDKVRSPRLPPPHLLLLKLPQPPLLAVVLLAPDDTDPST
ncbi:unnamed protein product [Vitrella brassicaformis CCMP3155]|uniref:Uncharacterized protein n=1 Tax=Vitrella brassicaformis (strain CCMP3155) TaxID=1169540 RepID=A0A0G4H4I7_VITBC|nr:unnamed protein product [Vitrella brassicaformis CCMP3155]|eukprot:CEM38570.1 unnamed protein product [Vitrella brassicaformis CCMP3155]